MSPRVQEGEPVFAVDEIEEPVAAEGDPDMAKLKSHWQELLETVGVKNATLKAVLTDTRPKSMEDGTLVLVCKSQFHQERMSTPENKILMEGLLEKIIGRKINLVAVLPEGAASSPEKAAGLRAPKAMAAPKIDVKELEKEEPIVAATMKLFGAKVVEVKRNTSQK